MTAPVRRAAIAFSKLRSSFGLVGIDADPDARLARVRLVRQWADTDMEGLVAGTAALYRRFEWGPTMIEQQAGEHLIQSLKLAGVPVVAIHSQKKVKDVKQIQGAKSMDTVEMTECLRRLKLNGQIRFPAREHASPAMRLLEAQLPFFSKHTTEAGSVDYYAPGEEPDDLVRALRIACFSVRRLLDGGDLNVVGGPISAAAPEARLAAAGPFGDAAAPSDLEADLAIHIQGVMGNAAGTAPLESRVGGPRPRPNNGWGGA